jgi:hypothetical protein
MTKMIVSGKVGTGMTYHLCNDEQLGTPEGIARVRALVRIDIVKHNRARQLERIEKAKKK